MKTKRKQDKVNIVTLGCSKNIVDSEVLYSQLKANKFDVEHESMKDDANVIIINTCGFMNVLAHSFLLLGFHVAHGSANHKRR